MIKNNTQTVLAVVVVAMATTVVAATALAASVVVARNKGKSKAPFIRIYYTTHTMGVTTFASS